MNNKFLAYDTETTGLDPSSNEIISFSAILLDGDLVEQRSLTVHAFPEHGCDPVAAQINGYTEEKWKERGAVTQSEMLTQIAGFIKGEKRLFALGHNIGFDVGFLKALFTREGLAEKYGELFSYHCVDTIGMTISLDLAKLGRVNGSYGLGRLCERFDIPLVDAHSASADVAATVNLYRHLVKAIRGDVVLSKPKPKTREALLIKVANVWRLSRGKHKDKTLSHLAKEDPSYLSWMLNKVDDLTDEMKEAVREHSP